MRQLRIPADVGGNNKKDMRQQLILICAILLSISCKERTDSLNQVLIEKILNLDSSNNKYLILDYYQGRFHQDIEADTVTLTFNGFVIAQMIGLNDSLLFDNIDSNSIQFFNYQSSIDLENISSSELDKKYAIKKDSVVGISNSSEMNLYDFNWTIFPVEFMGFMTFSEPIINKEGSGFIACMIYCKDYFQWEVFQFESVRNLNKINCQRYKVPGYKMSLKSNKISFIKPEILVVYETCK
jgi:hypothetical protein